MKKHAVRGEKEEDEEQLGGDLGISTIGRSNGYSSHEPWLIRHPTRRVVDPPLRPARGSGRFLPLDSRRALAIRVVRNVQKTRGTCTSAVCGSDAWDKTLKA